MVDITKTTHTHSEYVTIIAFPLQKWLDERASVLLIMNIACLVILRFKNITVQLTELLRVIKQYRDVECQSFWK